MESELPQSGLLIIQIGFLIIFSWKIFIPVVFLGILLLFSGLVSGSEIAFFSLSPEDIDKLKSENSPKGISILKLRDKPESLLATILISNNFINIGIVILSDFILRTLIPESVFQSWAKLIQAIPGLQAIELFALARGINFLVAVVIVTFLLVLFGEIMPKIYANLNNIKLAKTMTFPLTGLSFFLNPFSGLLVKWSNSFEIRIEKRRLKYSQTKKDELDKAIELTLSKPDKQNEEADILKSILTFNDVSVKQIMKSRVDVVAIDYKSDYAEALKIIRETGFSRIPVFKEDFDNIVGILYAKDLLAHLDEQNDFKWQKILRKNIFYIPEAKKINDLLKEFQIKHLHIAIVVDEYGGSSGIVTMEDIMEEVLGEIRDEFDPANEFETVILDENNFVFEGKTLINDVCRTIGEDILVFDEIKGESDSIAGMILEMTGELPEEGQELIHQQFKFKVLSVSNRRVEKIQLTINPKQ